MSKHSKKHGRKSQRVKKGELSSIGSSDRGSTPGPSIPTASESLPPTGTDTVVDLTSARPLRSLSPSESSPVHPTSTDASRGAGDLVYIKVGVPWSVKQDIEAMARDMGVSQNETLRRMILGYTDAYSLVHGRSWRG